MTSVSELLSEHVVLDLECLDRLYLNAYVPNLQVSGQVVRFMTDHLGLKIPSPAVMEKFRPQVPGFVVRDPVPLASAAVELRKARQGQRGRA